MHEILVHKKKGLSKSFDYFHSQYLRKRFQKLKANKSPL